MAEITAGTAIGWVVSPAIKLIVEKTQSYISNNLFKKAGLEDEMRKMETVLLEILSIMSTVEKQRIVDQNQVKLVRRIKEAVYEAEDIIDEFDYNILEAEDEKRQNTVSRIICTPHVIYGHTAGKFRFKERVKAVNEKLNQAKGSAEKLLNLVTANNSLHIQSRHEENWLLTSSIINEKIIGRENDCQLLIDLLFEQVEESPTIIQIIGQGGLGKTALAQNVIKDPRLAGHFDLIMWLTVSDDFDKLRLSKEMLKYPCENFSTVDVGFDMLQKKLETELASKKILLILDDVWYAKDHKGSYIIEKELSDFLAPLNSTKAGSKVIVTTRQGLVKNGFRSIFLGGLSDNDSWSLFEMCAFDDGNRHKCGELEPIGKEIVNKLRGLPLAIRVVGTQLRGNSDVEQWRRTLNDNPLDTSDIMNILRRSYEHLPENLKRCFAYCSLFPKDHRLKRDRLVHMWIAQGFVRSEERKNLENVGNSYFDQLLARSFFQVVKHHNKEHYVMHDLMNDLACHVSKDECLRHNIGDSLEILGCIRHLSLTTRSLSLLKNVPDLDKLRTLIVLGPLDFKIKETNFITSLKRIRVLDAQWISEQDLSDIGECKHLRYLSFRVWESVEIPSCFKNLYHLSSLFLRNIFKAIDCEVTLPESLSSLSSLVLVDTSKSLCLEVSRQRQLEKVVRRGESESAYFHIKKNVPQQLGLLGNMNNIKGRLSIEGLENVTSRDVAVKAQLNKKEHVVHMKLTWSCSSSEMNRSKYNAVFEALHPNSNLETLQINGYPGTAWPSWLESNFLSTIKSLELFNCREIKMIPALGQLPLLARLTLCGLAAVTRIDFEYGNGTFPSLERLYIGNFKRLEEIVNCPKVDRLIINMCPKFAELELVRFPTSQCLIIRNMMTKTTQTKLFWDNLFLHALTNLDIANCKGLNTLKGLQKLVSLRGLFIQECRDLLSLDEIECFSQLEFLAIFSCPKLNSLPKKGFPGSLQLLYIGGIIHQDLQKQIRSRKGSDWDKVAAIPGCHLYASFEEDPYYLTKIEKFKINKDC